MAGGSRNASIPNVPNSRPTPECLNSAPSLRILTPAVDRNTAGADLRGRVARPLNVASAHKGVEAVFRAVRF